MSKARTTSVAKEVTKVELGKQFKHLYQPSAKEVAFVDVPDMPFLMIDGTGDPNTAQEYKDALEALYSAAYTLKFMIKKEMAIDYPVMPLEGLWWTENMLEFSVENKELWHWTMMIMQPEDVTTELLDKAIEQAKKKKDSAALSKIRLERFHEGLSAQIMHIGLYAAERPTIEQLHAFIKANGYALRGRHHEIYVGDPRRAVPEKLRTVIRQPVEPLA